MGVKKYSVEEIETIKVLHKTLSYKEIGKLLNRSPDAIKRVISINGCAKKKPRP